MTGVWPMPCRRQNAVSAGYDNLAPLAVSSSWTRTRFPLQENQISRNCCRKGSAFCARWNFRNCVELERKTLRMVMRDSCNTRAISRLLTRFALSSRISVRCAWLNMLDSPFLSDSRRHPVQFPVRAFDLALRLFLAPAIHLRQSFSEPSAHPTQDGNRHLQVALHSSR